MNSGDSPIDRWLRDVQEHCHKAEQERGVQIKGALMVVLVPDGDTDRLRVMASRFAAGRMKEILTLALESLAEDQHRLVYDSRAGS